jgi:hypothetical protein
MSATAPIGSTIERNFRRFTMPAETPSGGRVMNGNHKITVLMERGRDVNALPREW